MDDTRVIEELRGIREELRGIREELRGIREELANGVDAGGAARGSEPIGTPIAFVNVNDTVNLENENNRSFVRSLTNDHERTNERQVLWDNLTSNDRPIDEESIRLQASRIAKIVKCKPGEKWRHDRRLVVVAAELAARIDAASPDGATGTRWLNAALSSVEEFRPDNSAAYFQSCLKRGLGEIDPVMRDPPTAQMLWIALLKPIRVPERWLAPPARQRPGETA